MKKLILAGLIAAMPLFAHAQPADAPRSIDNRASQSSGNEMRQSERRTEARQNERRNQARNDRRDNERRNEQRNGKRSKHCPPGQVKKGNC